MTAIVRRSGGWHRERLGVRASFAVLGVALVVSACGATAAARSDPPDPCFASDPQRCFRSHGAYVMFNGLAVGDPGAIDRAIESALEYWSAGPDLLDGWLITYLDHAPGCDGPAVGCTSWDDRTMQLQALDPSCPETAPLVHEVGHALLHDPEHLSSRWCWQTEQEETRRIVRAPDASPGCAASGFYTWTTDLGRGCRP
ncbi:MAG TPA: hypothetical protein VMS64_16380 [Candidatus Methylomirabilis sp.]|nr:hypothetical protein [Candidatus Methylomirabilis sp.]